jgi:hypothetical protein
MLHVAITQHEPHHVAQALAKLMLPHCWHCARRGGRPPSHRTPHPREACTRSTWQRRCHWRPSKRAAAHAVPGRRATSQLSTRSNPAFVGQPAGGSLRGDLFHALSTERPRRLNFRLWLSRVPRSLSPALDPNPAA